MFCPFNVCGAQIQCEEAEKITAEERNWLKEAYLEIAHVYINRACRRGYRMTMVYLPNEIAREAIEQLERAGFIIDRELPDSYRRARLAITKSSGRMGNRPIPQLDVMRLIHN